jgi:hypothetical protein
MPLGLNLNNQRTANVPANSQLQVKADQRSIWHFAALLRPDHPNRAPQRPPPLVADGNGLRIRWISASGSTGPALGVNTTTTPGKGVAVGDGCGGGVAAGVGSSIGTAGGGNPRHCRTEMASQITIRKRIVAVMGLIMGLIMRLLLYNPTDRLYI